MHLSHSKIQRFLEDVELPLRLPQFGAAREILRFGSFVGSEVIAGGEMDRAMEAARQDILSAVAAGKSFSSGTIYLAESLRASKGRFTRAWHAPRGGLWGCVVHVSSLMETSRNLLPPTLGLACCEAMHHFGVYGASVRWVNDVLVEKKKVAGFLAESFVDPRYHESYDLLGFGINVNNSAFPDELRNIASSLLQITGKEVDLKGFATVFFGKLSWYLGLLYYEENQQLINGAFSGPDGSHLLMQSWKRLSDTIGRRVLFGFDVELNPLYQATVLDVKDDGGLLLNLDDDSFITEYSGEVRYV